MVGWLVVTTLTDVAVSLIKNQILIIYSVRYGPSSMVCSISIFGVAILFS